MIEMDEGRRNAAEINIHVHRWADQSPNTSAGMWEYEVDRHGRCDGNRS